MENKLVQEKVKLDNILGYKEEKEAVKKIINLLNNYDKYSKQGISIPRGLIFQGPPGTGKTLFAKAIAGECNYEFYTAFSNDLEEETLSTLKKVFKSAEENTNKTKKPSLIYIDEIDKLTYTNTYGELVDKDARDATRFLLQKLDETKSTNKILIIASTNNYGKIPQALLRSGRFDKKILIELPDKESREQILKYYINNHPLFKNINIKTLALKTAGMSGADLKTLINNTLVEYITIKKHIDDKDFLKIINEMHFETIGKQWESPKMVKKILAHEIGHALVSGVLTGDYGTVSAIKYGDVQGSTQFCDDPYEEEDDLLIVSEHSNKGDTAKSLINDIIVALGGMAAEKVLLNERSIGVLGGDSDNVSNLLSFLFESGVFGFKYTTTFCPAGSHSEFFREKLRKIGVKLNKKYFNKACKIIKQNRLLAYYLIEEIHKNNDVLTTDEMNLRVAFYKENKKRIDKEFRNYKI